MSRIITYLQKEAGRGMLGFTEDVARGGIGLIPYIIGVPFAGGAAVGYLASKMSSPTDSDTEALQERVMDVEVREEVGMQQRKLQALKARLQEKAAQNKKAVSRKRDMFV